MKLIGTLDSPYVRKVRVVLAEKKIECEFIIDSPWDANSGVHKLNPLGKVPILVLDDSTTLFDSPAIVEYIDGVAPNNKLLPESNRGRAEAKRWATIGDGICDAAAQILLEYKRPREQQSAEWIARQEEKITRSLIHLSEQLGDNVWCMGIHYSLADVAVGCALSYLAFRFPEIVWKQTHPNLGRLYDKLMLRPSFADTLPA